MLDLLCFFRYFFFFSFHVLRTQIHTYTYMLGSPADEGYFSPLSGNRPESSTLLISQPSSEQTVPGCVFTVVIHAVVLLATLLSDMLLFEREVKGCVTYQF